MTMDQELLLLANSRPIFRVSKTSPELNTASGDYVGTQQYLLLNH